MADLITTPGCTMAVTVTGVGPAVLLMHGAEGNHGMFGPLVQRLAAHFTVIAYDQRDCGHTVNAQEPVTLRTLAGDAAALLAALDVPKAHVFGTSFGGRVAQALAHLYPDRVDRLVLGSTWPLPQRIADLNPAGVQDILRLRAGLPETAECLAAYFFTAAFLDRHPQHKALFSGSALATSPRSVRRQRVVADCLPYAPDDLRMPVLLLAGAADRVVPADITLAMARSMPNAEPVLMPDVGHATVLEAPGEVASHITRFCLTSVAASD